jgi:hypothetical protein
MEATKSILLLGICACVVLSSIPVLGFSHEYKNQSSTSFSDELDQQQTARNGAYFVGSYLTYSQEVAQSFIPQKGILTKIQLYIDKNEVYGAKDPYIVAIRKTLQGNNLAEASVNADDIPTYNPTWIDFHFSEISVNVGETYYIVSYSTEQPNSGLFNWGTSSSNPYPNGTLYWSQSVGQYWTADSGYDCCFKTYGYTPPIQIVVHDGFGVGVQAVVKNSGTAEDPNVAWEIQVRGGILGKINKTIDGTLDLLPGESKTVSTGPFFGFGGLQIIATADQSTKTAVGTQLFFFTIVKKIDEHTNL